MICCRFAVAFLCQLLILQPVFSQQAGIRLVVIEGADARNVVQQIAPRPLIVQVQDSTNRPMPGATVVFTAPVSGPGGEFETDIPSSSLRLISDSEGYAVARGYHPNALVGSYSIQVRAEFQGQTATAVISQTNIEQRKGHGKLLAILGIAGAAVGAAFAATRSDSASPPLVDAPTVTFGGSAVGSPTP